MIIGNLNNLNRYKGLSKNLDIAIEYILETNLLSLNHGRTNIHGENVFINRFSYTCCPEEECFFEGHKKYIDIHIVLSGQEFLGYADKSELTSVNEYDLENDFIKYVGEVNAYCKSTPSNFIIVFPEDIHMPKISINNDFVEKAVVKVLVN